MSLFAFEMSEIRAVSSNILSGFYSLFIEIILKGAVLLVCFSHSLVLPPSLIPLSLSLSLTPLVQILSLLLSLLLFPNCPSFQPILTSYFYTFPSHSLSPHSIPPSRLTHSLSLIQTSFFHMLSGVHLGPKTSDPEIHKSPL